MENIFVFYLSTIPVSIRPWLYFAVIVLRAYIQVIMIYLGGSGYARRQNLHKYTHNMHTVHNVNS